MISKATTSKNAGNAQYDCYDHHQHLRRKLHKTHI